MTKKRLLVLSVSIGSGHRKAGEALCQVYTERFGGEAHHVDFMRYALPSLSHLVEQSYDLTTTYVPSLYKWLYHLEDSPASLLKRAEGLLALRKCRELIELYRPDLVLSTHSFPAVVLSRLYPQVPVPSGTVITDYESHHAWANVHTQRYFVAHPGMVDELAREGAPEDRIRVTGIPVRPVFTRDLDRRELRPRLGLAEGLPAILLMSGGNAIGPLAQALTALAPLREKCQVVAIAGRSERKYRELKEAAAALELNAHILGFVENIHEYMAASDLLVSKAGGLTVAEALVMGLPLVVIRPTPGQEDGNTEFLCRSGAGLNLGSVGALEETVGALLTAPDKLEAMRQKALSVGRPQAAEEILAEMTLGFR